MTTDLKKSFLFFDMLKKLIGEVFSVTNFKGKEIRDINPFLIKHCIVFELLRILKYNNIGISNSRLINLFELSEIIKDITKLNKIDADELSRELIYFMEYSNLILEDQSKKYNFFLEDTAEKLVLEYERIKSKIGKFNYETFGDTIFNNYPLLFNNLLSCFLFGSYITFGRNRVSTIYKTLDMLSLPQLEESKKIKLTCSEFLKTEKSVGINMKEWGVLINEYGHTTSNRPHKWEERSRERMYMCVYFGWATKKVVDNRDSIFLTKKGQNLLMRYNELRELIFKEITLSKKEEVEFLYKDQANKRGLLLVQDINKFSEMLDNLNLSPQQKKESLFNHKIIQNKIEEINTLIRTDIIKFKITNHYHSTRVHQDFHSRPYLTLLRLLNELGPCKLKDLSTVVLQFKDFKKTNLLLDLINQIRKDRKIFDELKAMNDFALGRRWTGPETSIITIHGSLKKYLIDFALDFNLVEFKKDDLYITNIGKKLLNDVESSINEINKLTQNEIKSKILNIIKKEKINIPNIPNKLKYSIFIKHNVDEIIFYRFNDNIYELIEFIFPNKFKPWNFEGFRWNLEKAKEAIRWMIFELKYNDDDIKNKVSIKTFYDYGLFNVFLNYFKGYVSVAIMESFPEKRFIGSDFRYPRIYLVLGLVFQKILKKIYEAIGFVENSDFLYDTSYPKCKHKRKCRPDFQFKLKKDFTDKWVDAKYSNFTVFASETLRYKEDCKELEIVYLVGEKDLDIPLEGAKMISVDVFIPKLEKVKRFDLIKDLEIVKKEIIPEGYKPTEYDRKMLEKELEDMNKEVEELEEI